MFPSTSNSTIHYHQPHHLTTTTGSAIVIISSDLREYHTWKLSQGAVERHSTGVSFSHNQSSKKCITYAIQQ